MSHDDDYNDSCLSTLYYIMPMRWVQLAIPDTLAKFYEKLGRHEINREDRKKKNINNIKQCFSTRGVGARGGVLILWRRCGAVAMILGVYMIEGIAR